MAPFLLSLAIFFLAFSSSSSLPSLSRPPLAMSKAIRWLHSFLGGGDKGQQSKEPRQQQMAARASKARSDDHAKVDDLLGICGVRRDGRQHHLRHLHLGHGVDVVAPPPPLPRVTQLEAQVLSVADGEVAHWDADNGEVLERALGLLKQLDRRAINEAYDSVNSLGERP